MCTGEEGLLLVEVHLHSKVMNREMGGENVEFQFEGLSITCEDDLRKLVERINCDTEFAKLLEKYGITDEYIDEKEFIRVYREKIGIHKNDSQREKRVKHEKSICPMDKTGDCPYGRPEGICIGLPSCYGDVIKVIRGGNGRNEPSKEDSGNG